MNTTDIIIDFVSKSEKAGTVVNNAKDSTSAMTGDILGYLFLFLFVGLGIAFTIFSFKKICYKNNLNISANDKSLLLNHNITKIIFITLISLFIIISCFAISQNAFAISNTSNNDISASSNIKIYVDENTGEIDSDTGSMSTDDKSSIKFNSIKTELFPQISLEEIVLCKICMNNNQVYYDKIPSTNKQDIILDAYNNIKVNFYNMSPDLAKSLIGKSVFKLIFDVEKYKPEPVTKKHNLLFETSGTGKGHFMDENKEIVDKIEVDEGCSYNVSEDKIYIYKNENNYKTIYAVPDESSTFIDIKVNGSSPVLHDVTFTASFNLKTFVVDGSIDITNAGHIIYFDTNNVQTGPFAVTYGTNCTQDSKDNKILHFNYDNKIIGSIMFIANEGFDLKNWDKEGFEIKTEEDSKLCALCKTKEVLVTAKVYDGGGWINNDKEEEINIYVPYGSKWKISDDQLSVIITLDEYQKSFTAHSDTDNGYIFDRWYSSDKTEGYIIKDYTKFEVNFKLQTFVCKVNIDDADHGEIQPQPGYFCEYGTTWKINGDAITFYSNSFVHEFKVITNVGFKAVSWTNHEQEMEQEGKVNAQMDIVIHCENSPVRIEGICDGDGTVTDAVDISYGSKYTIIENKVCLVNPEQIEDQLEFTCAEGKAIKSWEIIPPSTDGTIKSNTVFKAIIQNETEMVKVSANCATPGGSVYPTEPFEVPKGAFWEVETNNKIVIYKSKDELEQIGFFAPMPSSSDYYPSNWFCNINNEILNSDAEFSLSFRTIPYYTVKFAVDKKSNGEGDFCVSPEYTITDVTVPLGSTYTIDDNNIILENSDKKFKVIIRAVPRLNSTFKSIRTIGSKGIIYDDQVFYASFEYKDYDITAYSSPDNTLKITLCDANGNYVNKLSLKYMTKIEADKENPNKILFYNENDLVGTIIADSTEEYSFDGWSDLPTNIEHNISIVAKSVHK